MTYMWYVILKVIVIVHPVYSDVLEQKFHICGGGHDLPPIVWIHLIARSKLGVALLFGVNSYDRKLYAFLTLLPIAFLK